MTSYAVVGFGRIAEVLYTPTLAATGARVSVVEPEAQRRAVADRLLPGALIVESLGQLERAPGDGVALNLLPGPSHPAVTEDLLLKGWHVFSEKPAASSAAQWLELAGLAESRGLALVSAPVTAYFDEIDRMERAVSAGEVGEVSEINGWFIAAGPARRGYIDQGREWFFGPDSCVARDLAPYVLSAVIRLLGAPDTFAWTRNDVRPEVPVRPSGSVTPVHGNAAIGVGRWGSALGTVRVAYRPHTTAVESGLEVVGTIGTLACDIDDPPSLGAPGAGKAITALRVMDRAVADRDFRISHTGEVAAALTLLERLP